MVRTNWSGNYRYTCERVWEPETVAEVQDAVRSARGVRALGTRHSFNGIADAVGAQISTLKLRDVVVDAKAGTATVGAGVRYGELALRLDAEGFALHNMASLPHISVGGAIATATHGSGMSNGNLATAVRTMELVGGDGRVHTLTRKRDGERFAGAVVGLGALGVVTQLTLQVQPRYEMTQVVYEGLPFEALEDHFAEIMSAGYSVSLFTDWQQGHADVWMKRRLDGHGDAGGDGHGAARGDMHGDAASGAGAAAAFYGARLATKKLHPLRGHDAEACTDQMQTVGPWYARLPHFKLEFTPSSGQELQSEYFVPFERGYEAVRAVETLREQMAPLLYVTELRAVAADYLWMSMAYGRQSLGIHFTWKLEQEAVMRLLPEIEAKLAPFGARPHWGKVFAMRAAEVGTLYPRMKEFRALAREFDPEGRFENAFLREHLNGE